MRSRDTGDSGGSSSSESRSGLTRYYHQNWEALHEAAGGMKEVNGVRDRDHRDRFELVVNDVVPAVVAQNSFEVPRRHHHHHHRGRDPSVVWKANRSRRYDQA